MKFTAKLVTYSIQIFDMASDITIIRYVSIRNTPKYFTESTNLMIFRSRDSLGLKFLQYFTLNTMPYYLLVLKTILCATAYFERTASSSLSPDSEGQKKQHKSSACII